MYSRFQDYWCEIAGRWNLSVEIPFTIQLSSDSIDVPVLLRNYGGIEGMLLITDFDLIRSSVDEIVELGYGFSCLSAPEVPYNPDTDDEAIKDMLNDWGWTGQGSPPGFLGMRESKRQRKTK